jgi:hypothetical protein
MVLEVQERGTDILASGESLVLSQLMEESAKIRRGMGLTSFLISHHRGHYRVPSDE